MSHVHSILAAGMAGLGHIDKEGQWDVLVLYSFMPPSASCTQALGLVMLRFSAFLILVRFMLG